jgi:mono/diheme cytochrome c family protein
MAARYVLGLTTNQVNRDHDYGSLVDNQLRVFDRIGLFTKPLPQPPEQLARLVDYSDSSSEISQRARSYLHANCSHCHILAGGGNAAIDLHINTALDKMKLIHETPLHDRFGPLDAKLVAPGAPERSVLYQRLARRGKGQMPPLASTLVDESATKLIEEWVKQMKK